MGLRISLFTRARMCVCVCVWFTGACILAVCLCVVFNLIFMFLMFVVSGTGGELFGTCRTLGADEVC
jgi:hypothetical protein